MTYDFYVLAAVSLFCIVVGRAGLHWKASYDRCQVRDPWAYRDHEEARRRALLQASQDLAGRCHGDRHLRALPDPRRRQLAAIISISDARKVAR